MISNKGYKEMYTTLYTEETAHAGYPVSVCDNNTVDNSQDGDKFIGILANLRGGIGAVQTDGFCVLKFSGTAPALGYATVVADGLGGIKTADNGREIVILVVDDTAGTVEAII